MTDESAARAPRRALAFIIITVVIDAIGIGIVVPVLPQLFIDLTGASIADAAIYGGWLTAMFGAAQFIATPILGNLGDRYGRRPVLLVSLAAFGSDYVLTGLAPTIAWLFVTRLLAGVFGATYSIANAYIADITEPGERARYFGLLGAAFGFGFIIGPSLGGMLGEFGPRVPFFTAAALALLNVLYGFFFLPESLPAANRRPFSLRRANPLGALLQLRRHPELVGLFSVMFLLQIAGSTLPATWPYYTMLKLGWGSADVGYSLAAYGLLSIIVQGWLLGQVLHRLGEQRTIFIGLGFSIIAYLGFALADSGLAMLAWIIPSGLGYLAGPALTSTMSRLVARDAQGELHGALASSYSLTSVFTPLLMTQVFSAFSAADAPLHFPGAPYLMAAALTAFGFVGLFLLLRRSAAIP
ncbi:MAG: TCR/Tet family MFS transporter [Gammaproteobacteria bacterium]|nr:TCR/Tet family MFS transporter [Gammaproteobacteria bacterium]